MPSRKRLSPEQEVESRAIIEYLKSQGVKVNPDGTVTLYHTTSKDRAESIRENGFVGTTAPIGGGVGGQDDVGPRSFFGFSKKWVQETWGNEEYEIIEIRVPAYYIRQGAGNRDEVYVEGTIKDTGNGVWEPDTKPTSTFYDRKAVKRYLKSEGFKSLSEAVSYFSDYGARSTDKIIDKMESSIRDLYSQAQKDIEKKTRDFWERHRIKDAMYRQQVKDGKIASEDYQAWLRGQVFQGKQWEAKMEQIEQILANTNKQALNVINGGRIQVFATNANWQAYQIEKSAGVNFGFGIYDADAVTRLLRDDPDLLPAKKLNVPKDKQWNRGNLNRQISQGIIQGEKLDDIAKRLRNVTDMNRSQSLTNARTMMTGAQNAGRQESYHRATKMGIKMKKVWLATLDGHTRISHRKLDGQAVDVDEPFKIGGYSIMYPGDSKARPEMVYNCRCTVISELVDYPSKNAQRRDNVTGQPIKDMTYEQWKEAKSKNE